MASPFLRWFAVMFLLVVGILGMHILIGSTSLLSLSDVGRALLAGPPEGAHPEVEGVILWELRLPRALASAIVGALLAGVGSSLQALFRNPLADPYVLGISSGSALGGAVASVLGWWGLYGGLVGFGFAFLTGLAVLGLVFLIAGRGLSLARALLAGIAVGTFLWALIAFVLTAGGQDAGRILFWLLGSFEGVGWARVGALSLLGFFGMVALGLMARPLTIFSVGEESAQRLGVATERLKVGVLVSASMLTAGCVATAGIIGFVGLFVPHWVRLRLGPDIRFLLAGSALVGAGTMVVADLLAQRILPGREVNVGVITALMGAPYFLYLLRRSGGVFR
jgi:iron complex transport system permease protein